MRKAVLLIIVVLFSSEILLGQFIKPKKLNVEFDFSIIIEMADIIASKTTTGYNFEKRFKIKSETVTLFTPITVYLSPKLNLSDYFGFEFRPGLFWGGEAFTGFEYGLFLRYYVIKNKLLFIGGINLHNNFGDAHNSGFSTGETITEYCFSIGYKASKSIILLLSYYQPDYQIEFYGRTLDYLKWESYKLKRIIKLGFEFQF